MFAFKKGQADVLRQAPAAVVILVVIAVIVGVGATILDQISVQQDTNDASTSVVNESLTVSFNTIQTLTNTRLDNTTVTVTNSTGASLSFLMSAAQGAAGQINITDATNDGNDANVSYTFNARIQSAALNATGDGLSGLTTFSGFQPTMAVIVVAVIVISLLLGGFALVQGSTTNS